MRSWREWIFALNRKLTSAKREQVGNGRGFKGEMRNKNQGIWEIKKVRCIEYEAG